MTTGFVHLRVHSEYSLVDGMVRIKPLVKKVRELGMPAVALTDHSNFFGLIKFYQAAQAAGVKPLIGCDLLIRSDRENENSSPLVLLVKNKKGYENLTKLLSMSYQLGYTGGIASIERTWLGDHAEGLIVLSAGLEGAIGRHLIAGRTAEARELIQFYQQNFPDSFYLEIQRTGKVNEDTYNNLILSLAMEVNCPLVATNSVRFLDEDEFEAHEARVCIHEGRTLDDPRRERRYSSEQYLKSAEQMQGLFKDIPEALENTVEIARRCSLEIELGKNYLPEYPVPEGYTTDTYFREVSAEGLEKRLSALLDSSSPDFENKIKPYYDRLAFELDVIINMGFAGYFLIVMEFIQWARDQDIPVGPGRGSGAGSLVAWVLGITDIDPLEYNLLFERFLNPERVSMPDFDIDFCMDGRDRVIQHVTERYGKDAVSQIITFGTMAAKAVVRDVARVQGKPYGLADKLSKLIPFDPGMTLERALEEEPILREFVETNEDAEEIMEMAFKLEGLARNVGRHAGGVVIAPHRITDFTPVYCEDSGTSLVTQLDKDDVEKVGLVKFDFLGLRTLTIIKNAIKSINARHRKQGQSPVDIDRISLDDPEVFQMLRAAKTTAVFQLESRGMKDLMKKVKPTRFGDLVALVALFRPGPMQLADDFIKRKNGEEAVDYLHPDLRPVLEDTYGVMLYQEQVMQIAQVLAGYTLADADLLRRAMGKKKPEEMAKQREVFLGGAVLRGVDEKQADHIFNLMEKFAGYGFNKPHSVAYALIAYQTAWLKHYYPADFMAAVLSADMQNTDKVVTNIEECREMGITIVSPDVNRGEFRFVADDDGSIIYGLGAIKGLGAGPVDIMVDARSSDGVFIDLFDFCERTDSRKLNRRTMEALIGSGALDFLVADSVRQQLGLDSMNREQATCQVRSLLLSHLDDAVGMAEQKARNASSGHTDLFGELNFQEEGAQHGYQLNKTGRTLPYKDLLAREKETLGLYLTGHPIDIYEKEIRNFVKTRIKDLKEGRDPQTVAGLVVGHRTMKSKKGETIAFITLDDRTGRTEVSVPAELFEQHHEKLRKDRVLVIKGLPSNDDFTGMIKIRAQEIMDLMAAREKSAKKLSVRLCGESLDKDFSLHLAELLEPWRSTAGGGCIVSIAYSGQSAGAEVLLGESWRVKPAEELIESLRNQYGNEGVKLHY